MTKNELAIRFFGDWLDDYADVYSDPPCLTAEIASSALVALRKEQARIDAGVDQYTAETVSMVFDCLPICVGCPGKVNGERTSLCDVDNPTQGKCLDQICKLVKEYGDLKAEKAKHE